MTLRYGKRRQASLFVTALLVTALAGCAQISAGKWYGGDKSKKPASVEKTTSTGEKLSNFWERLTTAIDRRPEGKRKSKTQSRRGSKTASGLAIVEKGDTYYAIAQRYKVPLNALLRANNARPPYALAAGDRLTLPKQAFYKVRPKDTLYSISRKHKTHATTIAKLNGISAPYAIAVGQMLQIPATGIQPIAKASAPKQAAKKVRSAPKVKAAPRRVGRFRVPVKGTVISNYGPKEGGLHNDGINIAARSGTPIMAAENGIVVYAGNELRGYGNLLLIRHSDGWVTAYAHASKFLVKPGDRVRQGDKVAEVGQTGNVDRPQIHFELRKGTRAVNPKSLI